MNFCDEELQLESSSHTTPDDIVMEITKEWVEIIRERKASKLSIPAISDIRKDILLKTEVQFVAHNQECKKGFKWRIPYSLSNRQIADIMLVMNEIRLITAVEGCSEYALLAVYDDAQGIYDCSDLVISKLIAEYEFNISNKDTEEVKRYLKMYCKQSGCCEERDLIPFNNGIFNYQTKQLMPFSPEYVFLSKYKTNYNQNARNVEIYNEEDGTKWDVMSWIADLSNDPEIVELLWEIIGATLRPNVAWNKSAWFYSELGNNGKGTLCSMLRNIIGSASYASVPLSDFGKDFMLEKLIGTNAIIVDENDVGIFIDKVANLKAVITKDVIQINRKHKVPIAYRPHCFVIQCLNELPRIKDKSDSFYRRQIFIPFDKCFTGCERKYIKEDYLKRPEVLEYVVYYVMNMKTYYDLVEPDSCRELLKEYKSFNDPIIQFWEELSPVFVWDLLPISFLYDLYKAWHKNVSPSGIIVSRAVFMEELKSVVDKNKWEFRKRAYTSHVNLYKMEQPEPLIVEYNLTNWMNLAYRGQDNNIKSIVMIRSEYRNAFVRK